MASHQCVLAYVWVNLVSVQKTSHIFHKNMASYNYVFGYAEPNMIYMKMKNHTSIRTLQAYSFSSEFTSVFPLKNEIWNRSPTGVIRIYFYYCASVFSFIQKQINFFEKEDTHGSQIYGFCPVCVH